jgi:hypothetical protein
MYRLVIHLPFKILLVHRQGFFWKDAATRFHKEHYSILPGIEVWTQREVDDFGGRHFPFPAASQA